MNRLTEWNTEHTHGALVKGDGYTKLAQYEDTGLEPSEVPYWRSAADELPEIKEGHCSNPVLVYLEDGGMAFSELQETFFGDCVFEIEKMTPDGEYGPEVTHWMPIPELPKEDDDETDT